ncbi:hypothetical protein ABFG93_22310 (plasmid) [Pseudalkalibacillus hwajinpoensis]|uniref:hypothetical protein n=1 Tax=Guptibacillus hwajinpoensis TaxID=208199 RepID=UPI00325AA628
MSENQKKSNSTNKLKSAVKSGNRRPSPAAAFFGDANKENVTEKRNSNSNSNSNSIHSSENPVDQTHREENQHETEETANIAVQDTAEVKKQAETPKSVSTKAASKKKQASPKVLQKDNEFWELLESKNKKLTMEDTHTRQTYLVRNDLVERLQQVSANQGKGFKTRAINFALEQLLDEIESK